MEQEGDAEREELLYEQYNLDTAVSPTYNALLSHIC